MTLKFANSISRLILSVLVLTVVAVSCTKKEKRILVFTKTAGYRHSSIEKGVAAIMKLGLEKGVKVDTTSRSELFNDDILSRYSAVIFLSTTGDVLSNYQQASFERYIQSGGGYVGIHAAADCEYFWPWYGGLVGGYFESHPEIQDAQLTIVDKNHPATAPLPKQWKRKDEWYNYKKESVGKDLNILIKLNENSYTGGKMKDDHPISWYHEYDGGKAFYTGLGHTDESYTEPEFLAHIWGGIESVMADGLNYGNAKTELPPDDNRFTKKVLLDNLDEPVELAVTPEGNVFFVQRKGEVFYFDAKTNLSSQINRLDVWARHEDGLLGITLDPDYQKNKWVYLFYSPNIPEAIQRVSRFTFNGQTLVDEKVILTFPVQRDECCHSAGSLTFGPGKNLYIAIGDNTNPFNSDGYAPIDEQVDRTAWDAQRSAGNTFDLRGKVLRIHPEPDGSYTIPSGNLFPVGTAKGRPEIYVMGCRNPYRISVDPKNGTLYWGDIGPDAGKDSLQGPMGYDEMNVAFSPGYYGWPFFIGNNKPYADVDFASKNIGKRFDPARPVNLSPNNTGMTYLPPARPAVVYYPYKESADFPVMTKGGRSAMAGPVYYYDNNLASTVKLPKYYDGCTIMYEWMRNLFFAMKVDRNGKVTRFDPLFSGLPLNRVIDMELAPDGSLYMVEYGTNWFSKNLDARLIKVEYSLDNRLPVAKAQADVTVGKLPLTVNFTSAGTFDADSKDTLSYEWRIESPFQVNARTANTKYTFTKPGIYNVVFIATDTKGNSSTATLTVRAGNEMPTINASFKGNGTFYWPNSETGYQIAVADAEDQRGSGVDLSRLVTTFSYVPQGKDLTLVAQGHQANTNTPAIKSAAELLIDGSDCKACHAPDQKSIGPSYKMISERYGNQKNVLTTLAKKVINGGAGNWGDHGMSAHPQLSLEDAKAMVDFIINYGRPTKPADALPPAGTLKFKRQETAGGTYVLTASYKDKGATGVGPLIAERQFLFRPSLVEAESFDERKGGNLRQTSPPDTVPTRYQLKNNGNFIMFKDIDLTGIKSLQMRYASECDWAAVELRLDSAKGQQVAEFRLGNTGKWSLFETTTSKLEASGKHNLYFVLRLDNDPDNKLKKMQCAIDWIRFDR